jgi:hypothetical protein
MPETKKPALAVGQKWRMKNGKVATISGRYGDDSSEVIQAGVAELFTVNLHNYKYTNKGSVVKTGTTQTDKILPLVFLEQLELVELIQQRTKEAKQSTFEIRAEFPATDPPKFPEHWDTRAQAEAIITRTRKFVNPTDMAREVSDLAFRDGVVAGIAYERERCIGVCQAMRPPGGRAWTSEQSACFEALSAAAENVRAGTDPWAGRPERVKQKALEALEEAIEHLRGGEPMRPDDLKETYEQIKAGLDLTF